MGIGVVAVLVLFFVLSLVFVYPAAEALGETSAETLAMQAITIAVWDGGMVLIVFRLAGARGARWRDLGLRHPSKAPQPIRRHKRILNIEVPWSVWALVTGLTTAYAAVLTYSLVVSALGIELLKPNQQIPEEFFDHDWVLPLIGFSVVVTAPLAEEIFFRGFLYGGLRRRLTILPAALISGVFFSLAHVDPGLVIPFTIIGAILANTYERSGTLFAPMGVHFCFNLLSFLALVFMPEARNQ